MNYGKSILISFLSIFLVAIASFPSLALAQNSPWYAPSYEDFNEKVNGDSVPENEIFGERYTQAQVFWIVHSLVVLLTGEGIQSCIASADGDVLAFANCMSTADAGNPDLALYQKASQSPILLLAAGIDASLYTPPASGIDYVASKLQDVNPVSSAYAQEGFGYTSLRPIQGLWTATRNATYALSVLAIVTLAFMIMLRHKVSPQLVVSVQSAIPKLAIGLVLITFSYAIAGFVIDLGYLLVGLISGIIHNSGVLDAALRSAGPIDTFNAFNGVVHGVFSLMLLLFINLFLFGAIIIFIAGAATSTGVGAIIGGPLATFAIVLGVIILVVALYALLKLFWVLFKNYMMILLLVVAGPFFILGGIVYSETLNFNRWLKLLVGHLSIFVVTMLLIFFAHYLTWATAPRLSPIQDMAAFNPFAVETQTISGVTQLPGFQGVGIEFVGYFAGLFIILTIPALTSNISKMIMGGRPDQKMGIGAAIPFLGAAAGGIVGTAQKGVGGYVGSAVMARGGTRVESAISQRLGIERKPGGGWEKREAKGT